MKKINSFSLGEVLLEDDFLLQVTQKDVDFLNSFNPERLLYNFRLTANLKVKASAPYSGWENTRIGGHTLGHYLTAAAQACACGYGNCSGQDGIVLRDRLEFIIKGLSECQKAAASGFIFGATMADPAKPELQFDKVEAGDISDTWVPWYTMHKILNGLVETVKLCKEYGDNELSAAALEISEKLGEWIYKRTSRWNEEERHHVLSVEYGAMNDCLYELYKCAKAEGYANAGHFFLSAHSFDEETLFEEILAASRSSSGLKDILNNKHANCTIPKFLGAINRCLTLMEEDILPAEQKKYLEYCKAFWQIVTERHSYITGGNSECEHFGKDYILDAERSNCNCETCNTHNMLKLTRILFMLTGEKKYADYYENTFINAILASVNSETGMTTYFQPMATGCFKTYCNIDVNKNYFWCCTGTGLENFTKLGDSFYFYRDDTIFINQYFSSSVHWKEKHIKLCQKSDLPAGEAVSFTVKLEEELLAAESVSMSLAFRLPDWCCGKPSVLLNNKELTQGDYSQEQGYIIIKRDWKNEDSLALAFPMQIKVFTLPDNPRVAAFKYGPVVLAAELGRDKKMSLRQVGVQCDVCANKIVRGLELALNGNYGGTSGLKALATETLLIKQDENASEASSNLENFFANINSHFEKEAGKLRFVLCDTNWPLEKPLVFSPYYLINNQRYGIYWQFTDSQEEINMLNTIAERSAANSANYIEGIGIGYGSQTEGNATTAPYMQESGSGSVADPHMLTRYARAGGSFSYVFKVLPDEDKRIFLDCTFLREDKGKSICIKAEGQLIAEYTLDIKTADTNIINSEKFMKSFEIPASLTNGKKELRIAFSGSGSKESARLAAPVSTSWL